jgi:hypothetical protein
MEADKLLCGTELYGFLVNQGSSSIEELAEAGEFLETFRVKPDEIKLAAEFACCIVGMHQLAYGYILAVETAETQIIFEPLLADKNSIADYLLDSPNEYTIYAKGLGEAVRNKLMELLDYDLMITQEAYLVVQSICLVRKHLLQKGAIKPIGRKDYLNTPDPALKETIKAADKNFDLVEAIPGVDARLLPIEFDALVIEDLAIRKIEGGMSLNELMGLIKIQVISNHVAGHSPA